jgi:hypothetical protein
MGSYRSWERDGLEALTWLSDTLGMELFLLAGNSRVLPPGRVLDLSFPVRLARLLLRGGVITPEVVILVCGFVTGYEEMCVDARRLSGRDVLDRMSVLATRGIAAVLALQNVSQTYLRVEHSPLALYRDRALRSPHEAHNGVLVAPVSPSGDVGSAVVYPTPHTYNPGEFTTQEWSAVVQYAGPAFFRHPETGEPERAFVGPTPVFVGREYPARWNIDLRFSDGAAEDDRLPWL